MPTADTATWRPSRASRAVLERALAEGGTHASIARDLGGSKTTIARRCRSLGLPEPKRGCRIPRAVLERALEDGASFASIARDHGWSAPTVARRCRDLGLPEPKRMPRSRVTEEFLRRVPQEGYQAVAADAGVTAQTVANRCRRFGIRPPRRIFPRKIDDRALRRELLRTRKTLQEIADDFGCSAPGVFKRAKKLGLPTTPAERPCFRKRTLVLLTP